MGLKWEKRGEMGETKMNVVRGCEMGIMCLTFADL